MGSLAFGESSKRGSCFVIFPSGFQREYHEMGSSELFGENEAISHHISLFGVTQIHFWGRKGGFIYANKTRKRETFFSTSRIFKSEDPMYFFLSGSDEMTSGITSCPVGVQERPEWMKSLLPHTFPMLICVTKHILIIFILWERRNVITEWPQTGPKYTAMWLLFKECSLSCCALFSHHGNKVFQLPRKITTFIPKCSCYMSFELCTN